MTKIKYILILVTVVCYTSLFAQQGQSVEILGVAVKGNITITENSIKVQSGMIEGKKISFEDIPNAIRRLWELNLFSDIQIYLDRALNQGAFFIIEVTEYPRLGKYELIGNKKVGETKINEEVYLLSGKVLSPNLISECKRKIRKIYFDEGYLLVDIEHEIKDGEKENYKDLVIRIKENRKVRIEDVVFNGNESFTDRKLGRVLKETRARNLWLLRVGEFKKDKYKEDLDLLRAFYRKEGYRDFEILNDTVYYGENKKRMFVEITLNEGPRYKYRNITFTGNTLFSDDILSKALALESGDWYNDEEFQVGLYDRINGLYMDRGYLFFQIMPSEVPISDNEIDVNLQIQENHQVSVNQIHIVGNDKTHENVVRRSLRIYPGDIFSREALMRSQREIFMLNYFGNVEPDIIPVSNEKVDVEVRVEEKSANRANLSVSISQLYGFVGGGGFEFNNFGGRGQQLALSYQRSTGYNLYSSYSYNSTPYESFSISFTDPYVFDTPNLVGGSVYITERSSYSSYYSYPFDLKSYGANVKFGRRFKWPDSYFRGTWIFSAARKHYRNVDEDYLTAILNGNSKSTNVSITQVINRDSRDKPEFPTTGSVMSLTSSFAGGILGGTEDFHKHHLSLDYYTPLGWKFVLLNNMQFGVIQGYNSNSIIPPDERFIMGGAGMVYGVELRGYDDNAVGPTYHNVSNTSYTPYGGRSLFKYSTELRLSISDNPTIYGLLFAEAGNVWATLGSTDPFDLKRSAGAGVRMYMPQIGMIGIDFGYGFDDIDKLNATGYGEPEGWNTHFIFGTTF